MSQLKGKLKGYMKIERCVRGEGEDGEGWESCFVNC